MHYSGSNRFLFANATKIYEFKGTYSEIKKYPLCLGIVYEFSVDYNIIGTGNIINIHKYLMKKYDIK